MPLATFRTYDKSSNFKRTEFVALPVGQHLVRIIDDHAVTYDTHYVRNTTIACAGEGCPICENNIKLRAEHPTEKNMSSVSGWSPRRQVAYINVLDRTPVKMCPNEECKDREVKRNGATFPSTCPSCGALLTSVKPAPLNKVKMLSKGKQFFEALDMVEQTKLDENETPIGIQNFDVAIMVPAPKSAPIPSSTDNMDVVTYNPEDKFDPEKALIRMSPDEIRDFLRGVSLADIFKARQATRQTTSTGMSANELVDQMEEIFGN